MFPDLFGSSIYNYGMDEEVNELLESLIKTKDHLSKLEEELSDSQMDETNLG